MKLCRIGNIGEEKPAIIDEENNFRDLSSLINDFDPDTLNFSTLGKIQKLDISSLPKLDSNSRIGACISKPSSSAAEAFPTLKPKTPSKTLV